MSVRQAVILAGGLGSRLGELTQRTPKPLLPVAGRPFLHHLLAKARASGLEHVLILAGHLHERISADLVQSGLAARLGLQISLSVEPAPLGTGGALSFARTALAERFLLLNGDTWFDFDWRALMVERIWPAMMALRPAPAEARYDTVELAGERVTGFWPREAARRGAWINGGVYCLDRARVPETPRAYSLETELLPDLAAQGVLGARPFAGDFIDIGVPDSYAAAQRLLAASSPD